MAGHSDPRLAAAAQAMRVERLERRRLEHDHVQRSALHGRLLQADGGEQFGGAAAGAEDDALCADGAAVDAQADQLAALLQRLDPLTGQQAVAGQFRQADDQARHVKHQLAEAVHLALELRMLQRRRQRVALHLTDPRAHRLAGEVSW